MPVPDAKPHAKQTPKRGWLRRFFRWLGIVILVVAIFHRPLFDYGVRFLVIRIAAHEHLNVDLHFSGTIFTNLTVTGIRVSPTGGAPSPVKRIEIDRLHLDYSIPSLIRHGIGELLQSYEIVNATLELVALPSQSEPEREEKHEIADTLNNILGQPAFYADRVRMQNFNISVRSESSLTVVKNFNLVLDPEQPGVLTAERVQIPGVPVWTDLHAVTSYAARNFFIKRLELSPDLILEEFNFDASERSQNKGSIQLKAQVFGGALSFSLAGNQLNKKGENLEKSYDTVLKLSASDVSIESAAAYFGAPKPPVAKLADFSLVFTGEPEKPRTWKGNLGATVDSIALDKTKIDSVSAAFTVQGGKANLTAANVVAGRNSITLTAQIALPESVNDFPKSDVDAALQISAPDLPGLTAMLPEPATGTITGGGPIRLRGGKVDVDLALDVNQLVSGKIGIAAAKLRVKADKRLAPAPAKPLDELNSRITAELTNLHAQDFTIDSANLDVENHNDLVNLRALEVHRAENSVSAHGSYRVPPEFKDFANSPVDGQFAIQAPTLETFGIVANGHTLSGHVEGRGELKMASGMLNGGIQINGGDFRLAEFQSGPLSVGVRIADNLATIEEFSLKLRGSDQIAVTGKAGIQPPFAYEAGLLVEIANLSALQPLLAAFNVKQAVSGALHIDWNGKGDSASPATSAAPAPPAAPQPVAAAGPALTHNGRLGLVLAKGKVDKIDLSEIRISGIYGVDFAKIQELRVVSGPTTFTGELALSGGKLKLDNIHLQQAGISVLSGEITVPVDLKNSSQPIPFDQPIAVRIAADKLDVEKLLSSFGQKPPASGILSASFAVDGTIQDPSAQLKISGRVLKAKMAAQLDPADFDLDVAYGMKQLTLQAGIRQRQIQPLAIRGRAPLDIEAVIKQRALDPKMPIEASIQLPPTSLSVIPKFTPLVRRIDGTAGIDVRVGGTVEKPALSGFAVIDLKNARMTDENVPALDSFHARISFANDTVAFNTFEGDLGGGKFKLGGNVRLAKLTNPVFDLHLESKDVLVKRDDSITVRADTDITFAGPLNAASIGGAVYVTHSRFFKEIDILPIALPGKSKPAPRSAPSGGVNISFPDPPLRDWKFDLAIKTRKDDPFLIRGNLANGKAEIDLHLGGTGLTPTLEGNVHIPEFNATLPFCTLNVSRGFVYFLKDTPFQPSLDIQADSQIRDYLVHAYIYGKATDPQVSLTAEPPLQYSDIIALLATGSTVSEMGSNADVLASRAAMLAIQQLYRKIFHRGQTASDVKTTPSLSDRFQMELGAIDARTGQQEVASKLKLTDQFYLLGNLGVGGQFSGNVKYLIRFR